MQKIKKHHCGFISSQNGMGQFESDTKKKKLSFQFIPTLSGIGNSQKIAKKMQKVKKLQYGFNSSQNSMGQAENDTKKM